MPASRVNVALKLALSGPLGPVGLAIGTAVGAWINFGLLIGLARRCGYSTPDDRLYENIALMLFAAAGAALVTPPALAGFAELAAQSALSAQRIRAGRDVLGVEPRLSRVIRWRRDAVRPGPPAAAFVSRQEFAMSAPSSIVIVGAGHGGVQAAASLREEGFAGRIALVGDETELPYHRPPLSKAFLKGEVDLGGLALRAEAFFHEHRIDLVFGAKAAAHRPRRTGGSNSRAA